jgi:hypothetical protein
MTGTMKATSTRKTWRAAFASPEPQQDMRRCDRPGCAHGGEFRAPRGRDRLHEYYWFCLNHVREYNASWDYYAGMSAEEIEAEVRQDTTWQRPTWKLGVQGANRRFTFAVNDPFDLFESEGSEEQRQRARRPATPEEEAMLVLELEGPLTMAALKARYKELVKRTHPDANNGDKEAEELFKRISQAYHTLKNSLNA